MLATFSCAHVHKAYIDKVCIRDIFAEFVKFIRKENFFKVLAPNGHHIVFAISCKNIIHNLFSRFGLDFTGHECLFSEFIIKWSTDFTTTNNIAALGLVMCFCRPSRFLFSHFEPAFLSIWIYSYCQKYQEHLSIFCFSFLCQSWTWFKPQMCSNPCRERPNS